VEEEDGEVNKKRTYQRRECNICGVRTTRLDLHLIRTHRMQRGPELLAVLNNSEAITTYTKETAALDKCLTDFK